MSINFITMPFYGPISFRMIGENLYSLMNFGIVLCTLIEAYIFPLGIIKWMIIVTKYGGITKFLRGSSIPTPSRSRYKYSLQLMTSCRKNRVTEQDVNLMSHVSVVIEAAGGSSNWIQLGYCGQDCTRIPPGLWSMYGPRVQYLDLSYNSIETLKGLEQFVRLEELILDNNKLCDSVTFPHLPCLRTLSINNNQITDLEEFINKISERFPNLTYLSLLSNKACPNELSDTDKDDSDYQRYRFFVIYKLPNLRFLDSRRVTPSEWKEAVTRGEFMRVRRPPSDVTDAPITSPAVRQRPLPVDLAALGKHKGAYGKCHYKYTGKHSEGNRFILNSDL